MVTKNQIAGKLKFYSKPYGRQWKWRYQTHGHIMEPTLNVPKALANEKIIDPLHPKPEAPENKLKWTPPRRHPLLDGFFPQATINEHPHFNEKPVKLFDRTCKFHAGIEQASLLTKTMAIKGLPDIVNSDKNYELNANNDSMVENYIKQALAFNPTKELNHRLKIPRDVKLMIAREYSTPKSQQMSILLDNLIRLCNMNINKKLINTISDRRVVQKAPLSTILDRCGDKICIRRNSEFALFSKKPSLPLASDSQVFSTKEHQLVDMFPIFPTIDLLEENVYDSNENTVGLESLNKFNNLHTFFHVNEGETDEANAARLIMFAFGSAIAQSKKLKTLEMDNNLNLKTPIVVNGVSISDSHRLNFVLFQLNTLNLKDNNGIKNLCFYDTNNELYYNRPTVDKLPYPTDKNIQRMAMRYLQYNPEAFRKMQAILAYGAN